MNVEKFTNASLFHVFLQDVAPRGFTYLSLVAAVTREPSRPRRTDPPARDRFPSGIVSEAPADPFWPMQGILVTSQPPAKPALSTSPEFPEAPKLYSVPVAPPLPQGSYEVQVLPGTAF